MNQPLDESTLAPFRSIPGPDGRPLMMQIVDMALANLPESLATLRRAVAEGDAPALRAAAHKLKGGSGSYGAMMLSACAKELEVAAAEGNLDAAPSLLEALEAEAARVMKALEALRAYP
jgi:HPt (histidine-containing phosphotransfer) domain-containing protein